MSDPVAVAALATSVMTLATGATILLRFSAERRNASKHTEQVAIDKGRGQGLRDAEISSLRATVDYHNDKIGELDDARQDMGKVLAQLTTDNAWIKTTLADLKDGVDELRRR